MKKALLIALVLSCTACADTIQAWDKPTAQSASTTYAAAFLTDPKVPPMIANHFVYDPAQPVLRGSQFIIRGQE